jgi:hypothetical protein
MIPRFTLQDSDPADQPSGRVGTRQSIGESMTASPPNAMPGAMPLPWYVGPPGNFREAFCRRFAIAPERFEIEMLRRCMSRRARLIGWLLRPVSPDYYSIDRLFVRSIGRAQDPDEFTAEVKAFRDDPANRAWGRRVLKLRLSIWRVLDVADEVLPHLNTEEWHREMGSRPPWN